MPLGLSDLRNSLIYNKFAQAYVKLGLTEEFRFLLSWLLSGLILLVMLFRDFGSGQWGWWSLVAIVALIGFYATSVRLLVTDAVVAVLIIGVMLSILLPSMQDIVLGIIMVVGVTARIIIKYGVRSE